MYNMCDIYGCLVMIYSGLIWYDIYDMFIIRFDFYICWYICTFRVICCLHGSSIRKHELGIYVICALIRFMYVIKEMLRGAAGSKCWYPKPVVNNMVRRRWSVTWNVHDHNEAAKEKFCFGALPRTPQGAASPWPPCWICGVSYFWKLDLH